MTFHYWRDLQCALISPNNNSVGGSPSLSDLLTNRSDHCWVDVALQDTNDERCRFKEKVDSRCNIISDGSSISQRGIPIPEVRGANLLFGILFTERSLKMKKNWTDEGH